MGEPSNLYGQHLSSTRCRNQQRPRPHPRSHLRYNTRRGCLATTGIVLNEIEIATAIDSDSEDDLLTSGSYACGCNRLYTLGNCVYCTTAPNSDYEDEIDADDSESEVDLSTSSSYTCGCNSLYTQGNCIHCTTCSVCDDSTEWSDWEDI